MKRFYLICTLLFFSFSLTASNAVISFQTTPKSGAMTANLSSDGINCIVSLKSDENGFTLSMPPVISYGKNGWYIGEIRKSGLLRFLLNPLESSLYSKSGKPFIHVSTPSLKPELTGVAKSFECIDFAVFSPVFSPTSPFGLYCDYSNGNMVLSSLFLKYREKEATAYLVDWEDIFKSGLNIYSLIGFKDSDLFGKLNIKKSAFMQAVYRDSFGLTGMLGWNAEIALGNYAASLHRRISNNATDIPKNLISYQLTAKDITLGYTLSEYEEPSYGGTAQRKTAEYYVSCNFRNLSYKIIHEIEAEKYTGTNAGTIYEVSFHGNKFKTDLNIELVRLSQGGIVLKNFDFVFESNNSKFCIDGTKFDVIFTVLKDGFLLKHPVKYKFTINQNKEFSFTVRL